MIPLYIIEEHHEAFYIWNLAAAKGFIPPCGNALLHVDHHPDFECGYYRADLDAVLFSDLETIERFTYENLGIADFIRPAIYEGIFNEIVFLQKFVGIFSKPEEKLMFIAGDGGLCVHTVSPLSRRAVAAEDSRYVMFTYSEGGPGSLDTPEPVTLDIDLDYFCWDDSLSGVPGKQIEITGEAYLELTTNRYHPFRLLPKVVVSPVEENGRFYVRYTGLPQPAELPSNERIEKRVGAFVNWLKREGVTPRVISVCRSRFSGYTPPKLWAFVENSLLTHLKEIFDYDTQG